MTTFYEALPERKSSKHGAIQWVPAEPGAAVAGRLTIDTKRARVVYTVAEFETPWEGRAFRLVKLTCPDAASAPQSCLGTDDSAEAYSVFCGSGEFAGDQCDCKGFIYKHTCKHVDSCRALMENSWL
jgi:hypothetical protein